MTSLGLALSARPDTAPLHQASQSAPDQIDIHIIDLLKRKPKLKASEIYEYILNLSFSVEKATVVKHLHALVKQGKLISSDAIPPTYHVPGYEQTQLQSVERKSQAGLLVVIDLGNVHNILQNVEKYIGITPGLEVKAYADLAYNHYKPHTPDILWHNDSAQRETTDVKLIADTVIKLKDAKYKYHVIIMSLDKVVCALESVVKSMGHQCTVAKSWDELRIFLE